MEEKFDGNYKRMVRAVLNRPGGNTPQNSSCTATYDQTQKLSKLDEPDMTDNAGEVGSNS